MNQARMTPTSTGSPAWARAWLIAAGVYNLAWGAWTVLFPGALFSLIGMDQPRYPSLWQCVGMIVGVYGVGYLIAARNPRIHWPIVLVGLLGKLLGPIGFLLAAWRRELPPAMGLTLLTNDLVWWIPFAMILWDAARWRGRWPDTPAPSLDAAMDAVRDQTGRTVRTASTERPLLLVLLRHAGCTFCKEALADLARQREAIASAGLRVGVVTMGDDAMNASLARRYDLGDASWFADPDRLLYRALDLRRGRFLQLFGPKVWIRGVRAALAGHGVGKLQGDGFQMPGAFVVRDGRVIREFRHKTAADRADFAAMTCELPA